MYPLFQYMAESASYMGLFYIFYLLFLSRDTRFRANRIYLVSTLVAAQVLPLVSINTSLASQPAINGVRELLPDILILDPVIVTPDGAVANSAGSTLLIVLYAAGFAGALALLLINSRSLLSLVRRQSRDESRIVYMNGVESSGFSAFGYVFLPEGLPADEEQRIRMHEELHIRHGHFIDIAIIRFTSVLQWFNPFVYLYERSLRATHEFEVDYDMINQGETLLSYQALIINQVFGTRIFSVHNAFAGKTLLKKRIIMMTKTKTGRYAWAKLLLLIPAFLLMFVLFSCKSEQDIGDLPDQKADIEEAAPAVSDDISKASQATIAIDADRADPKNDPEVYVVVEEMPTFQGGDINTFRGWIAKNVKYPPEAAEKGIQGQVFVLFVVEADGNVSSPILLRGVDPILDNEALRVIRSSPEWGPGRHDGKAVPVKISVTVNFKLS